MHVYSEAHLHVIQTTFSGVVFGGGKEVACFEKKASRFFIRLLKKLSATKCLPFLYNSTFIIEHQLAFSVK